MWSDIKLLVRPMVLLYKEMATPSGLTKKQQIAHTKKAVTILAGEEVNLAWDSDDPVVAKSFTIYCVISLIFLNADWPDEKLVPSTTQSRCA